MLLKRENLIVYIMLAAITAACFSMWYLGTNYFVNSVNYVRITSENATYDLSDVDFQNTVISITGDVEFIPDVLLTPEEFEARAGEAQIGRPQDYSNVSTSRLYIIFPQPDESVPHGSAYAIARHSIDFAHAIYINGGLRGQVGKPGLTKETEEAGYTLWSFAVTPSAGSAVEIVSQASNFVHRDTGGHSGYMIGSEENIKRYVSLRTDFDGIVAGLFIALFLVHLTLYIILRSYRANLYLAALCLTWALRTGVIGVKIYLGTIPLLTWEAAFRIEYLSIPICAIFVILLASEVFPAAVSKRSSYIVAGVSSVFLLMYLFADTLFMSYSLPWFYVFYTAVIVWLTVRIAITLPGLYRRGELSPESIASLYGLGLFFYAAIHDTLYYSDISLFGINYPLTDVAMLIFSFSQMIAISRNTIRRFAAAWEAEKKLLAEKAQLEERKAQLEQSLEEEKNKPPKRIISHGSLTLDTIAQKAMLGGKDLGCSPKEFSILRFMLMNIGQTVDTEKIYEEVWKQPMLGDNRALQTRISSLRTKLTGSGFEIASVYGKGYCLREISR